ncbi:MAG: hypothetical protein JXR97_03650, partial [Planctomycetes bacterium]|nr:hypothetical protein [Planctomycetota bacterium]
AGGHVSVLTADEGALEWRTYSLGGRLVDNLELSIAPTENNTEAVIEKSDILTDALAVITLRKEIKSITRQVCRAVDDPSKEVELPVRILNQSTRLFSGDLVWTIPENSGWKIYPQQSAFSLSSGKAGVVNFRAVPTGTGGPAPELLADVQGVGYMRQQLVITPRKTATIPISELKMNPDGRFSDSIWKEAHELTGFNVMGGTDAPFHVIRYSAVAATNGLALGLRCEAKKPGNISTKAKRRDANVHHDESVEIFIDPDMRARDYMQFASNIRGVILDRSSRLGISWNPRWERGIRFGRTEDGLEYYNIEILIPYNSLGLPERPKLGDKWAMNITRNDYGIPIEGSDKTGLQVVQWAPTYGSNAHSGCYGVVTFVKPGKGGSGN